MRTKREIENQYKMLKTLENDALFALKLNNICELKAAVKVLEWVLQIGAWA